MDWQGRFARYCATGGADHVLVSRLDDIRWLTGFTGGTAELVVHRGDAAGWLLVDGRYSARARAELDASGVPVEIVEMTGASAVEDHLATWGIGRLGIDADAVSVARMRRLSRVVELVDEHDHLDDLRRVKEPAELALIERAASIAGQALMHVVADGMCGRTERQVRNRLDHLMLEAGADGTGFDTIVATGPNGARPHHEPGDTVIEAGHGVVVDMGALVGGYRSDMTRTVTVGQVGADYAEMHELVRRAQRAAVDAVAAGVVGRHVDAAARGMFERHGVGHEFTHGTGHGVGLRIHETPILSPRCEAVLREGEVVTVEPGLYRGGIGGVRIEDLVVVTGTGCRILTSTPKDLSCPPSPRTT
jgi:Xaa-Pro aminopeptidase